MKKIRFSRKVLNLQLLFVALVFLLMFASSSFYVHRMLQNHLSEESLDLLNQTKLKIEAEFFEPETALTLISNTIHQMILLGYDADTIERYMVNAGAEMRNKTYSLSVNGLFGYFETFGNAIIHSEGWTGGENYDPTGRPWYKTAVEAGDKIAVTPIYFSARTNDYTITYVRRIFDNDGLPLGIVCLNKPLDRIRDYIANMHISKDGYGILFNDQLDIVAFPVPEVIGQDARRITVGSAMIVKEIEAGNNDFGLEIINYFGEISVSFTTRLENGWVLTSVTPKANYYRELREMMVVIGILDAFLCILLMIILIRIDMAKKKADEQNSRKSTLLAEMEKMREADEHTRLMLDTTPLAANYWDNEFNIIACNEETTRMFGLKDKQEYMDRYDQLSPEYQPCKRLSKDMASENFTKALTEGYHRFEWMHQKLDGEEIPSEITLVRVNHKNGHAIAGYVRDLREYKQMMNKIEQRDNLLDTVNKAAVVLLSTEGEENMMASIFKGMELLGHSVDVDRVQIWQNEIMEGSLHFVHKYEWLSETGIHKAPVPVGLHFPYSGVSGWERKFSSGECINCPLSELSPKEQDFFAPYEIKSIVIIPLFLQDRFWGFFSLDDCRKERSFSEEEINILRSGGLLTANAFIRTDMIQNIHSTATQLEVALKEAQEANKAKSKFLAAMSHEIRTPMNVVLGVTESQLVGGNHPQKVKEAFEKIYDSGHLLLHIINDILDLSKIEAGKFELNPVKYEVLSLINDAANMNIMQHGHGQIKFSLKVDENIPTHLFGDELRIKQVLNNLLSNAFKYTGSGEVILSFASENVSQSEKKMTLVINVSDTGQGMTPEEVAKLFDEYSRFNLEANRTTVGTGLGMAITRNLVNMMGGRMYVDSTPGKGTNFTVHIPQDITGPGILGKEAAEKLQMFSFSNKTREINTNISREPMPYGKVLIVDDMRSNLDVAKLLMGPYELQIDTAESGFEAIEMIKKGNVYDIVFMDHMMPKMDGIEAVTKIRGLGYNHPIIALTANAVTGQQEIFLKSGFEGFISKPIDIRQLNDSLNKFIRDKERSRKKDTTAVSTARDADKNYHASRVPEGPRPEIKIPGVDEDRGLTLYGGEPDIYIAVLRSYVPNAFSVIEKLRNVSEETLADYTVNVHGLKGISAGIGAENLREAALNLELKSKAGDLSGVLAQNEALLEEAENVASAVNTWLEKFDREQPKLRLARPDPVLLARLRKSCEDYDMNGIDDVMDELESSSYDTDGHLVTWLREKIDAMDFPAAAERLLKYE